MVTLTRQSIAFVTSGLLSVLGAVPKSLELLPASRHLALGRQELLQSRLVHLARTIQWHPVGLRIDQPQGRDLEGAEPLAHGGADVFGRRVAALMPQMAPQARDDFVKSYRASREHKALAVVPGAFCWNLCKTVGRSLVKAAS